MKKHLSLAFAYISLLFLAACVAMEAPKTFDERWVYASKSIEAAADTASSMVERGRLTKEQGKEALSLVDQAAAALDASRAFAGKGDISTAQGQLDLALTVLTRLEAYLKENQ